MSRLVSAFSAVRGLIFVALFAISLIFNITLLASNFVFGVASSAFSALTGTRSLVVSQADEIASLNANLLSERQIHRELRGEVAEVSTELAAERAAQVANRQVVREVRTELAETSTRLAVNQAELVASRQIQRELRGEVAEVSLELSSRRASQLALRNATRATAGQIAERNRRSALRNVASMPGEALPLWGTAVIVGVTGLELYDLCQTMIDMTELQRLFDPNLETPEDQLTVCNMEVPSREEIWEAARTSPATAWNAARNAMPTAKNFRALELPDFEWTPLRESIGSTAGEWTSFASDAVGGKFDELNNWWNE
ncbi:hypothetical protein RB2150_06758 [Rhodobacterales bacterium HTCC2150]|nr:hypothetical protein RB2150_06758 [Rhodobacterales bacterium HTCC2150] [Rhodobacteraceae bacterium HTCC2150]